MMRAKASQGYRTSQVSMESSCDVDEDQLIKKLSNVILLECDFRPNTGLEKSRYILILTVF